MEKENPARVWSMH